MNGFRYLWNKGTVFVDAHHGHANTETIVGHTTLATGAHPAVHGMIGNVWFDRTLGRTVYNIEDDRYRVLTVDIAATLAAYLVIKLPSGSASEPLMEVFSDGERLAFSSQNIPLNLKSA